MSATTPAEGRSFDRPDHDRTATRDAPRRRSMETKATEFIAYVLVLAGILVAGALSKAGD